MKESKTETVLCTQLKSTVKKLAQDGWRVTGYDFANEGPLYTRVVLERDEKPARSSSPKAAPKAKPKAKPKATKKATK